MERAGESPGLGDVSVTPPEDVAVVAIPEVGGIHHRYERRAA
jgi:hypothetical protein